MPINIIEVSASLRFTNFPFQLIAFFNMPRKTAKKKTRTRWLTGPTTEFLDTGHFYSEQSGPQSVTGAKTRVSKYMRPVNTAQSAFLRDRRLTTKERKATSLWVNDPPAPLWEDQLDKLPERTVEYYVEQLVRVPPVSFTRNGCLADKIILEQRAKEKRLYPSKEDNKHLVERVKELNDFQLWLRFDDTDLVTGLIDHQLACN